MMWHSCNEVGTTFDDYYMVYECVYHMNEFQNGTLKTDRMVNIKGTR